MLQQVLSFVLLYKYAALFLITFGAAFVLPLPATISLLAAGAFAAQGYFNFFETFAVGFAACLLGDNLGYWLSLKWGRKLLERIGFKRILESKTFKSLGNHFIGHSFSIIFFSRFLVTGVGAPVNILSGLSKVPYRKFFLYDILGEFVYVLLYLGAGFIVGDEWQYVSNLSANLAILLVLLVVIIFLQRRFFRKRI